MTFAPTVHRSTTPFTVFIQHLDKQLNGNFRPHAVVGFDGGLRASGFLASLPAEELRSLMFLLSFVTPNGDISPSLAQLSEAMRVSQSKARARLERLQELQWQGARIVRSHVVGGQETFSPVSELAPHVEERVQGWQSLLVQPPPLFAAPREAIIEHSRRTYTRPREEVEREIRDFYGWRGPDGTAQGAPGTTQQPARELSEEEAAVWQQLVSVGLTDEQADSLLARVELVRIGRQLQWLPYHRRVRNVAGFLLSAIEDDYEMPPMLRRQVIMNGTLAEEEESVPAETSEPEPFEPMEADVPLLDTSSLDAEAAPGEDPSEGEDVDQGDQSPF